MNSHIVHFRDPQKYAVVLSSQSSSPHSPLPHRFVALHFPQILGFSCHLRHYHLTTEHEDHRTIVDALIPFMGALSKATTFGDVVWTWCIFLLTHSLPSLI